jgi:acyl-CoA synthetase (AMP-forming)/AMP-acid ligase II
MRPHASDWLFERMARFSGREAILCGDGGIDYERLCTCVAGWCRTLDKQGVSPGAVVGISGKHGIDAAAMLLALAFNGYVAAPLPADGEDGRKYLDLASAEAVIELGGCGNWSSSRLRPGEPPALLLSLRQRGVGGLVVFSSGTTGQSKAALFDFAALIERYREKRPARRTLLFLRLDHLGGVHTMLHTLAQGGTLVISEDRRPHAVCRAIEHHRVELLPATPTFLRMLALSGAYRRHDLSSLRMITYGTEPMPAATLKALVAVLPGVRFKQTYGLSELGVLPTRSKAGHSLWLQVGGVGCEARIVDNVLWIRSETAMLGYLNAPSPFDQDGWYNTEDAVEVDGPYVRILGRTTDLINVGGQKVYPAEVENILLEMDNVRDVTVWGHPSPVTGQVVAARLSLTQPENHEFLERRIHGFCRERLADYKVPLYIEIVDGDHHGQRFKKIRPTGPDKAQWPAPSP